MSLRTPLLWAGIAALVISSLALFSGRTALRRPAPVEYSCFLENTCPPCPGKPIARSQKKEKRGQCQCHQVTYQCSDGSEKTCWDNCE